MIIATEERVKTTTRMVIAAVIVAAIFVGISIPMMLLVRGGEKRREIPWIKVTGVIDRTVTFQNGDVTLVTHKQTHDILCPKGWINQI